MDVTNLCGCQLHELENKHNIMKVYYGKHTKLAVLKAPQKPGRVDGYFTGKSASITTH